MKVSLALSLTFAGAATVVTEPGVALYRHHFSPGAAMAGTEPSRAHNPSAGQREAPAVTGAGLGDTALSQMNLDWNLGAGSPFGWDRLTPAAASRLRELRPSLSDPSANLLPSYIEAWGGDGAPNSNFQLALAAPLGHTPGGSLPAGASGNGMAMADPAPPQADSIADGSAAPTGTPEVAFGPKSTVPDGGASLAMLGAGLLAVAALRRATAK